MTPTRRGTCLACKRGSVNLFAMNHSWVCARCYLRMLDARR